MAMNKVQFQRGMSLSEFQQRYGSEAKCEAALQQQRWPGGLVCTRCGSRDHLSFRRSVLMFQCKACQRQTSLIAGTVFESTKLPLKIWFQALFLLAKTKNNVAALELMRVLGVCYRTAWRMKHKLLQAMEISEQSRKLEGTVEIDDAYLGGEFNGGKPGRGSPNKTPFVIAVSTVEGRPRYAVIDPLPGFTKAAVSDWVERRLCPECEVYSDGLPAFTAVIDHGHAQTTLRGDSRRDSTRIDGARWVNTVLSNVKRSLDGTYHHIKNFKYAHRYLAEAAWRFNRRFNLRALFFEFIDTAITCQPWTERRLRAPKNAY